MNADTEYPPAVADFGDDSFGLRPANMADPQAIQRLREWVCERFKLPAEAPVMVSQVECALEGCPPLETVVAFWEGETRYHFKLFKPVADVTPDNLPFAWMKESLIVPEGFGCECC
jgi:nitrate reductase delta subunit